MSKKANARRKKYAEKQEQKGKNVVVGIIAALIILALIYMFTTISSL